MTSASLKASKHPAACQLYQLLNAAAAGLYECESRTAGAGASFDARGCCRYSGYLAVLVLMMSAVVFQRRKWWFPPPDLSVTITLPLVNANPDTKYRFEFVIFFFRLFEVLFVPTFN